MNLGKWSVPLIMLVGLTTPAVSQDLDAIPLDDLVAAANAEGEVTVYSFTSRIAKATACGERVVSLLETEPTIADDPNAIAATDIHGRIELQHVSFGYSHRENVFSDASLVINPGERVILRGPSGSGKSTLGRLLLRFYDPTEGCILLDRRPLSDYTLESLRSQYAVVLQDAILFNASIRDNIAYGRLDADDSDIVDAAKNACIHDQIVAMPAGYDTIVSERGNSLSGGQRQRISIARAIIRNAPIVILDEPLTGIDSDARRKVERALGNLTSGRTCITITHDEQFMPQNQRIIELIDGKFVEAPETLTGNQGILDVR